MRPSFAKALLAAAFVPGLAACASPAPTRVAPVVAHLQETSYCYISLADTECYRIPIPGQSYRLVGSRPTAPR